jgi:hypothetical protein
MDKYEKLTEDLKEAYRLSKKAVTGDDGGSANLDSTFLTLPRWNEKKVIKAVGEAGLHCGGKVHWIGNGYLIGVGGGQGDDRVRARNAFASYLESKGYDALHFDKMD